MELTVDGLRAYAYTGARAFQPELDTVVFVHGGGLDHCVWLLQSRYLAHHGYNVLAFDLPGHGRSAGDSLPTIDAMAAWVLRAMDVLGVERAAVTGHSMGSLVALETAATAPTRVSLAGLLGIAVPMPVTDALLAAAKANDPAAFDMVNLWGHGFASQLGGNPTPGIWMTGSGKRLLERARPGVLYNDLVACNAYQHGLDSAARVACPALVLLGAQDVMASPRAASALIAALPNPIVRELSPCGHMLMSEQPDATLDALRDALALAAARER